jgi:L-fuconolactonase
MGRVIDAHVHFWNPDLLHYPWLKATPALQRAFLPEHFGVLANGTVDGVIFVEANCQPSESSAELDFVDGLAEREPRVVGSVAYVDLWDERSRADTLRRLARRERVVGVRQNIQGQPRGVCLAPSFVRGVHEAADYGFTFDLCITADQLEDAIELVRRCPDVRFVLDHCAKPAIRDDAFSSWALGVERLASYDHVSCKLSGLLTEARPDQRSVAALRPYVEHVQTCFGAGRLLYGSDWPVCTLAGGDLQWRSVVEQLIAGWSPDERRAFYADNAIRLYGLARHANR